MASEVLPKKLALVSSNWQCWKVENKKRQSIAMRRNGVSSILTFQSNRPCFDYQKLVTFCRLPRLKKFDVLFLRYEIGGQFYKTVCDSNLWPQSLKNWPLQVSFSLFSTFNTVLIELIKNKICRRLDSNRRSPGSEVTAQPTVPRALSLFRSILWSYYDPIFVHI